MLSSIQLLRGFADNDEVECITFERDKKDVSDSFRKLPFFCLLVKFFCVWYNLARWQNRDKSVPEMLVSLECVLGSNIV